MKEYQTPLKDHARLPPKLSNRVSSSKKIIPKKSLFSSISEDPQVNHSVESSPISLISQIDEVNRDADVTQTLMTLPDPALSPSTESLFTSDLSPSSESTMSSHSSWTVATCGNDASKFGSMGAEVVASFLKQARTEVLNSAGVDAKSKKLLDALVEIVIEDLHTVPEERDQIAELISMKAKIRVVCLLLLILTMTVLSMFSSGSGRNFHGPLPT
ncbi:uncharacterized protein LOC126790402 [Argentina anserina]|uniref:uncharacterized protein LOC126790402 n=1 Tax=Argentina anserina TaxID=57926 RepID=UPI0021762965|nr:uncharacterized protein LOC126790402 [Potentilla anserina]XP_050372576.1 uncharacterized protein LOC126790402 [Potentilla anserina]